MKVIIDKIQEIVKLLTSRIAFIPTILSIMALFLSISFIIIEASFALEMIKEPLDFAMVKSEANARVVLSTIIGAIISLMVFSFSMVMIVLNRASNSLSPRVVPQLVARKSHQFVLGGYLATIIFSLIVILNINTGSDVPSLSVLVAILGAVFSLGLFIYFIHSISSSIQTGNILQEIFHTTSRRIELLKEKTCLNLDKKTGDFAALRAESPGYYRVDQNQRLIKHLNQQEARLFIKAMPFQFLREGEVICWVERTADLSVVKDNLQIQITPSDELEIFFGFQKISEIAIRALSPAINDPITAVLSINMMCRLLDQLIKSGLKGYVVLHESNFSLQLPSFDLIVKECISPIGNYANGDARVIQALNQFYTSFRPVYAEAVEYQLRNLEQLCLKDVSYSSYAKLISDGTE